MIGSDVFPQVILAVDALSSSSRDRAGFIKDITYIVPNTSESVLRELSRVRGCLVGKPETPRE